jgi:hypothetical protein
MAAKLAQEILSAIEGGTRSVNTKTIAAFFRCIPETILAVARAREQVYTIVRLHFLRSQKPVVVAGAFGTGEKVSYTGGEFSQNTWGDVALPLSASPCRAERF